MSNKVRIIVHVVLALAFIGAAVMGFKLLKSSKEALGRQEPEVPLPLVRTVPIHVGEIDMTITGEGTVQPMTESQIVPQVGGEVIQVSKNLVNGGTFEKGERLLSIDPRDYEIAATLAEAEVKDAESNYEMAVQESEAARQEWERMHPGEAPPPLVAREPQLSAARAVLEAKRANLEKARLDLERTTIKAPFNGRVASEQVDIGQYFSPGQAMATLYATDAVEIVVPLENKDLNWFTIPGFTEGNAPGAKAMVKAQVAGRERTWPGRVNRVEGKINDKTRMVNVVIRVQAPYATRPPLSVGQFTEIEIYGQTLADAALIPRAALQDANTVWAVNPEENRMYFRNVSIARTDRRGVVVEGGLKASDLVVVSPLKGPTDGMKVRYVNADDGGRP
ncbi:MAG: efflux RND transporter periplasmic adaptor subunit [Desulfobacterales bacterium]